jgi:hypothetical protein
MMIIMREYSQFYIIFVLASSIAHIYPINQGRTLSLTVSVYGFAEGVGAAFDAEEM